MPQHRFSKDQSKWHLIDQRFERARRRIAPRKIRVRPSPEVAMPIPAIVSLHSEAQRIARDPLTIESDLSRKHRVGVRCPREADPTLAAQGHAKCRTITQVPR